MPRRAGDGETRGHLDIADTIYTHVADAEQYAALEGENVIQEIRGTDGKGRRSTSNRTGTSTARRKVWVE
jgi:hypothetical protein